MASTASSQACSLSRRRRRQAIQTSGLNRYHDTNDLRRDVHEPVAARDVRQLVSEDDALALGRPVIGRARQDDLWWPHPPGYEERWVVALQQHDPTSQTEAARHRLEQCEPATVVDASRTSGEPREPREADREKRDPERESRKPDAEDPPQRDGRYRDRHRRGAVVVAQLSRLNRNVEGKRPVTRLQQCGRDMPGRDHGPQRRCDRRAAERDRQHGVPQRCGSTREEFGDDEADGDDGRHGEHDVDHREPSFLALLTRSAIRFKSSSDRRLASPPRTAATTCSADPSKNVSTRCFSADLRAA